MGSRELPKTTNHMVGHGLNKKQWFLHNATIYYIYIFYYFIEISPNMWTFTAHAELRADGEEAVLFEPRAFLLFLLSLSFDKIMSWHDQSISLPLKYKINKIQRINRVVIPFCLHQRIVHAGCNSLDHTKYCCCNVTPSILDHCYIFILVADSFKNFVHMVGC